MYILVFISITIALCAMWVARSAYLRIDNPPRSFHFTLSEAREIDREKGENVFDKESIRFYVLYLSGSRVFFDEDTFENINISSKIDTVAKINNKREIVCYSLGGALIFGYVTDPDKKEAEQGEELHLSILSLPQSSENRQKIENYLKGSGWKIKRALSLDDLRFSKDNLEVYISYIS